MNFGCEQVLASPSGVMVHPMSTPQIASGSASRAGNVIDFLPKQATHASGSSSQNAANVLGAVGQANAPPLIHRSPVLSATATQPNGRRGNVWAPPSGWTSYQW